MVQVGPGASEYLHDLDPLRQQVGQPEQEDVDLGEEAQDGLEIPESFVAVRILLSRRHHEGVEHGEEEDEEHDGLVDEEEPPEPLHPVCHEETDGAVVGQLFQTQVRDEFDEVGP